MPSHRNVPVSSNVRHRRPAMQSSAQRIHAQRRSHLRRLTRVLAPVVGAVFTLGLVTCYFSPEAMRSKLLASAGLSLDVIGAVLVALPLFLPYKDPTEEGKQFLTYYEPYRSAAVVQYQERLTLPMQVGAALFIFGFVFQLVAQWI